MVKVLVFILWMLNLKRLAYCMNNILWVSKVTPFLLRFVIDLTLLLVYDEYISFVSRLWKCSDSIPLLRLLGIVVSFDIRAFVCLFLEEKRTLFWDLYTSAQIKLTKLNHSTPLQYDFGLSCSHFHPTHFLVFINFEIKKFSSFESQNVLENLLYNGVITETSM